MTVDPSESAVESSHGSVMEPVRADERIAAIDILRGLSLFGIIAANIRGFAGPAEVYVDSAVMWPGAADRLAQVIVEIFIQGKFIAIFSFLFGVGFAVQLGRAEARGSDFGWIYARRLAGLAVIGLVHGLLIWWGDILLPYALTGLLLLFFRRSDDLSVTFWGIALYLMPIGLIVLVTSLPLMTGKPMSHEPVPSAEELATVVEIYGQGSWSEIQRQRVDDAVEQNWSYSLVMIPQLLGLFLFGVMAWRRRIFQPLPEWLPRYRLAVFLGLSIGIACNVTAEILRWSLSVSLLTPTPELLPVYLLQALGNPALSIAFVAWVILVCQEEKWLHRLESAGAVGRTALSNYLLQSILATMLFYSYGLGLYGIGPAALWVVAIAIYAIDLALSEWWISRWRFGPAEWLWRSLTYGRIQPMRRR